MGKWSFELIDNWDDSFSDANLNKWQISMDNAESKHVFFHPVLVKSLIDTYRPIRNLKPIFLWGKSEEGNQMFMPLVLWKRNWKNAYIKSIVPAGYSDFDYHDPIFLHSLSDQELDGFWNELLEFLKTFKADEILIDGVCRKGDNDVIWRQGDMCPSLSLLSLNNDDDLFKFLKTSLRGDVRRQTRRLQEKGELAFKRYTSWEDASETFDKFMTEHRNKWPNAYKAPHFHENLLKNGLKSGIVDFTAMTVDNVPIAWHLGFHYDGRYYYYMPCGDREYAKMSPVKVHLFNLISLSIQNGDTVFDHLKGDENYKDGWSDSFQYVYNATIENSSLSFQLKHSISKLAHKLR